MAKNEVADFSGQTCVSELGLFHSYFVCKINWREISMIIKVIFAQTKPIWLFLKNQKHENHKFVHYTFIIHRNRKNTSIQLILKSNFTSFMFYNIFYWMNTK